jgi:hypothetical protein
LASRANYVARLKLPLLTAAGARGKTVLVSDRSI